MSAPSGLEVRHDGILLIEHRPDSRRRRRAWLGLVAFAVTAPVLWWLSWGSLAALLGVAAVTGAASLLLYPMLSLAMSTTTLTARPKTDAASFEIATTYGPIGAFDPHFVDTERVVALHVSTVRRRRLLVGKFAVRATTDFEDGTVFTIALGFETEAQAQYVAHTLQERLGLPGGQLAEASRKTAGSEGPPLPWIATQVAGPLLAGGLFFAGFFAEARHGIVVVRLDLLDPASIATFELERGDVVELRGAVTAQDHNQKTLLEKLDRVDLKVELFKGEGLSNTQTCALYSGVSFGTLWKRGAEVGTDQLVSGCRFVATESGRYQLKAEVTWPLELPRRDITRARLEIRRQSPEG